MYCGIKCRARGGCASLAGILIVLCAAGAAGCNAVDEPAPSGAVGAVGDDSASGASDEDYVSTPVGLMHRTEAGFRRFDVLPLAGPASAVIAYK